MFSNNLKRSVATLGVVAGLLAAAVPASAMSGSISGKEMTDAVTLKAGASEVLYETVTVKTDAPAVSGVTVDAGSGDDNVWNNGDGTDAAKGTQVGSEGVKAPTRADDQVKVSVYNPKEIGID